ncbi:MAG: hypothetical protein M3340_02140 [Actinomycetota bacterium]|nr:hypothetical protein [Actinomycetota bacterium]
MIACNYREAVSSIPWGAKAYVVLLNRGNAHDRVEVLARSRSGRLIRKWENIRRLGNFRLKTLPPEHPQFGDDRILDGCTEEDVAALEEASLRSVRPPQ